MQIKRFLRRYFAAVAALVIAVTAMSFSLAETSKKLETQYWFAMNGAGTAPTTVIAAPDPNCPKLVTKDCARLYNESQTEIIAGVRQVKSSQINAPQDWRTRQ